MADPAAVQEFPKAATLRKQVFRASRIPRQGFAR
jgi:hypothetical protein